MKFRQQERVNAVHVQLVRILAKQTNRRNNSTSDKNTSQHTIAAKEKPRLATPELTAMVIRKLRIQILPASPAEKDTAALEARTTAPVVRVRTNPTRLKAHVFRVPPESTRRILAKTLASTARLGTSALKGQ